MEQQAAQQNPSHKAAVTLEDSIASGKIADQIQNLLTPDQMAILQQLSQRNKNGRRSSVEWKQMNGSKITSLVLLAAGLCAGAILLRSYRHPAAVHPPMQASAPSDTASASAALRETVSRLQAEHDRLAKALALARAANVRSEMGKKQAEHAAQSGQRTGQPGRRTKPGPQPHLPDPTPSLRRLAGCRASWRSFKPDGEMLMKTNCRQKSSGT